MPIPPDSQTDVAILGGGPAGLTAAYLLSGAGKRVTVLEAEPQLVGGISRTVEYKGFRFDIGGHRFFSKNQAVEDLWTELLGADMLVRPRSSRILYGGKFYSYPLSAGEALKNLGIVEATRCVASYLKARAFPIPNPKSFQDWVTNHFGKRLFGINFKASTEKVWGMSCQEISADWAAQRIKGLSRSKAILNAILPKRKPKNRSQQIKSLIGSFRYPRLGPGMMWDAAALRTQEQGGTVRMGCLATGLEKLPNDAGWRVAFTTADGTVEQIEATHAISSMPLGQLLLGIKPALPAEAIEAAQSLKYRDFLTVALIVRPSVVFEDNWIYIHEPGVKVGRVQNFRSWSPELVPDPNLACYGLEYFCFEGDGLWNSTDKELIALATRELAAIGLAKATDVIDGHVVRQPKAYPVYDDAYAEHVATIRRALAEHCPNLHVVGRNGMHKYNNQDHAMMTAMLTVQNILAGKPLYDVWEVNQDAEYHEVAAGGEGATTGSGASGLRQVPRRI